MSLPDCEYIEMAHLKLKVTGTPAKISAFHWVVGKLDPDYPLAPPKLRRMPGEQRVCPMCDGLWYRTPMLSPAQLKAIGKQINDTTRIHGHLKVKVLMYNLKCGAGCGRRGAD